MYPRLEENELSFIHQHRAAIWDLGFGRLFVSSDRSVTTWNFLGSIAFHKDPEHGIARSREFFEQWALPACLKITPFTRPEGLERALARQGWSVAVTLNHMAHPVPRSVPPGPAEVIVRIARSCDEVRVFSEVQSAGFGVPDWVHWVHKVNLVNAQRPDQRFYVAEIDGRPVGVTLLLITGSVAGLYAVATLPAARRRGVARALIHRAAQDALSLGADTLCLNTAAGGPAQLMFAGVGFEVAFASRFYVPALPKRGDTA
jgi:GNAT superfamily N-acetyltransferase